MPGSVRGFVRFFLVCGMVVVMGGVSYAGRVSVVKRDPYVGAIVMDAATGRVVFEDNADTEGYPASTLKLMDLYIVLDKVKQGVISLDDKVTVTAKASKMGGSQVYLAENEVFSIDELLYALMIQSANDAATALAIHIAGSTDGFVKLMNEEAADLFMTATTYHSVHGLPPGPGQLPDVTTARDMALQAKALLEKHPEALKYTSVEVKGFRNDEFIMRTHNKLLKTFEGCDGLKTGYFSAAGFSIVATAERKGVRVIAVVLGSTNKKTRNAKARELLARGFLEIAPPE